MQSSNRISDAERFHYNPSLNRSKKGVQEIKITTTNRDLKLNFNTHLHPFVPDLVRRLVHESLVGLQDIDTEYVSSTNAALHVYEVTPDSTVVQLGDGTL